MNSRSIQSRRRFLKRFAAAAVLGSGATAAHGKMQLLSSALGASGSDFSQYRALVCVFLYGGSDSFNMYVPTGDQAYAEFAAARPQTLRVAREELLPTSTALGFNPLLPRMHSLFEAGNCAIIRNVGNLSEPVTRAGVINQTATLPFGLFAHDHQQEQWQKGWSSQPATLVSSGWGGRIADMLQEANTQSAISPNLSVGGSNFWINGGQLAPVSIHPVNGLTRLGQFDASTSGANVQREASLNELLALGYKHPMKQQVVNDVMRARMSSGVVSAALAQSPNFTTAYDSGNTLASQLRMVARMIAARDQIAAQRQVFFVALGGWDTHNIQNIVLPQLLTTLDEALGSFYETLDELQLANQVTTFTASDFGRSLSINGDGTDHGWGGHSLVMGGAVNGNSLYGTMPSFTLGGNDDTDNDGRIIPSTSINQYGAVLGRWLGVTNTQLSDVFPDLENFGFDWDANLNFLDA